MSPSPTPQSWISWFEIPVDDLQRAKSFYEAILDISIEIEDFGDFKMGIFPHDKIGGALVQNEYYKTGPAGPLIYLNVNPDLEIVQERIEAAGGTLMIHKRQISPEHGYMAVFSDTEGNRIALHSDN
ncbi:VOC family protein [Marinigracilibium pacificum]|uniref:VOC family protein n=1 Tax=Marinigracilibium pacificum TaxID=2729599 RepID=A0A848IWP9_9BACT|nr:VOC family protein [Marinigracilibium pacificum]NMM48953.1 VOC family protein [Marinigracilibium pacificum]